MDSDVRPGMGVKVAQTIDRRMLRTASVTALIFLTGQCGFSEWHKRRLDNEDYAELRQQD